MSLIPPEVLQTTVNLQSFTTCTIENITFLQRLQNFIGLSEKVFFYLLNHTRSRYPNVLILIPSSLFMAFLGVPYSLPSFFYIYRLPLGLFPRRLELSIYLYANDTKSYISSFPYSLCETRQQLNSTQRYSNIFFCHVVIVTTC